MCIEIGLRYAVVILRGYGGESPTAAAFFDLLRLEPEKAAQATPSASAWQSANIRLFSIDKEDLTAFDEPDEEFALRVEQGFLDAAQWLSSRPHDAFPKWRSHGYEADVFIGGWLLNEQIDLKIPPQFLLECGRAGLPIQICTND